MAVSTSLVNRFCWVLLTPTSGRAGSATIWANGGFGKWDRQRAFDGQGAGHEHRGRAPLSLDAFDSREAQRIVEFLVTSWRLLGLSGYLQTVGAWAENVPQD